MPMDRLKQIWPEWSVGKRIGGGAYGTVYEACRNDYGVENHAAIKIISIPASEAEIDTLRSEGLDIQATKTHLETIVNEFVNEIKVMLSLEGRPNIVNVKDYKVVEKKGELGWYIFILMELLIPFAVYTCDHKMTEAEVIKLGCDICTALETCAEEKIIHRDIKPGNILVHKSGAFKLGDFGIARKLENMTGGLSKRYTPKYMAPEIETSRYYDARVDIYSLGIVLYELLNGRRIPFQPNKQINSLADIGEAVDRRNRGEKIDAPCNASPAMADVILRACAHDPDMRFSSATEMKQALMSVANGTYEIGTNKMNRTKSVEAYDSTWTVRKAPATSNSKSVPKVNTFGSTPKKKNKFLSILLIAMALVLLVGGGTFFAKKHFDTQAEIDMIIEEADLLAEAEDFAGAIAKITSGLEEYAENDRLENKFDEYQVYFTNQQITEMIANADLFAANGDYEEAIGIVEVGLADYPNNSSLQGKLTEYNAAIAAQVKTKTLADAQALASAGEYESAMSMIEAAQEVYGKDKEYDIAYKTYHKAHSLSAAETYVANGDYPSAIKVITEAQDINANDVDLIAANNTYCDAYASEILAIANSYVAEWKIDDAIAVVNDGLKVIPNSSELSEKRNELDSLKPVSITTLQSINTSYAWKWNEGIPEDPFGNSYSKANNYACFSFQGFDTNYVEYRVYKEYGTITGVIAPHVDSGEKHTGYVQIYKDDVLCYTSETIGRKSDAVTFNVDISGAEYIRIFVAGYHNLTNGGRYDLILSDVMLWSQQEGGF